MLHDLPNGPALLALLAFEPPDWRQYYEDLWARYPALSVDWVNVGYLNLPRQGRVDQWEVDWWARMAHKDAERQHRDWLMLAQIRALALAVTAHRGAARTQARRKLDQYLDEVGLRPTFPGGSRIPQAERLRVRQRYDELRTLIDELRAVAADGDATDPDYQRALLIRFPLLTEEEVALLFSYPYRRRGATADAALVVLARRLNVPPATLDRYLFPR